MELFFQYSNAATGLNDGFLSSVSDTEFDELENIDNEESMQEVDTVSLSSSVSSLVNVDLVILLFLQNV